MFTFIKIRGLTMLRAGRPGFYF